MDFKKLYINITTIYNNNPTLTKLIEFDFNIFSDNILTYSPLKKLNKLIEKILKIKKLCSNEIILLNKNIKKTNQWIIFTNENLQKTKLNEQFITYCNINKVNPKDVQSQLFDQKIIISNKQLKKQCFIYTKQNVMNMDMS